jgi:hypothetical protein
MNEPHLFGVRSTKSFHRLVKTEALKRGMTIGELLAKAFYAFLESESKAKNAA